MYRESITKKGDSIFHLVFESTPFYAQGGGQIGDTGFIETIGDSTIKILNTVKENDTIIHVTNQLPKELKSLIYDYRDKKEEEIKELKTNHLNFKNEIEANHKKYEKLIDEAAKELTQRKRMDALSIDIQRVIAKHKVRKTELASLIEMMRSATKVSKKTKTRAASKVPAVNLTVASPE